MFDRLRFKTELRRAIFACDATPAQKWEMRKRAFFSCDSESVIDTAIDQLIDNGVLQTVTANDISTITVMDWSKVFEALIEALMSLLNKGLTQPD